LSTKPSKKITPPKKQSIPIWLPLIIVAGLALIVVAVVSGNDPASAARPAIEVKGAPALTVDKEKVDFGNVTLGQTVEVKFEVTNVGDQPLRFKEKPYVEVAEGC
jgi:hypothetical protein